MISSLPAIRISGLPITACNILARGLHLLLFLSIGNRFGATTTTDTVLLLQAPLLILISVASSVAETVIMPAMHRAFLKDCSGAFLAASKRYAIAFTVPTTVLLLLIAGLLSRNCTLGFMLLLAPTPLLATLSAIQMGVLNAVGRHWQAMLGPLYGSLAAISFVFVLPVSGYSLASIFLFFEIGRLGGLWLHSKTCMATNLNYAKTMAEDLIAWTIKSAKYQVVGSLLLSFNPLVDFLFASQLGPGAVTTVEYANRLWNIVPLLLSGQLTLLYASTSRAASHASINRTEIHRMALKLGAVATVLSVFAIITSGLTIDLLYGSGRMDPASRLKLGYLLSCYLVGAGPFFGSLVYVRTLSTEGRTRIITFVAGFGVAANIILDWLLIKFFRLNGIGLATSLTYICNAALVGYFFNKRTSVFHENQP